MPSSFPRLLQDCRSKLEDWASYWISRSSIYPIKHQRTEVWEQSKPLISVVIPCYNHGHYLADAVDSILNQTWQDFEIIIVNDGSTDPDTIKTLKSFTRPKTTIIHHTENRGLPATRNTGIKNAVGKYICCLDADDKLHPTYLEKALLVMETNPGIDFVYSWTQVFGDGDRVWYASQFDPTTLIHFNQLNSPAVLKRQAWEAVGGFREEMREGFEDWEFWIRLAYHGYRGYRIPEKLIFVRRVGRSFIHRAMEIQDRLKEDIRRYNPEVYQDEGWLKSVTAGYREIYPREPFLNLIRDSSYRELPSPRLWTVDDFGKGNVVDLCADLPADFHTDIVISSQLLPEEQVDRLLAWTPYVYILPHYLPRYSWRQYIEKIWIKLRGGIVLGI